MKKKSNCKVRHGGGGCKKLWLIMRFSVVFLFITLLTVSASTYSQQAKLSVKLKNATLKEVLQQIQNTSEFEFFFNHEAVDLDKRISLSMKDASVEQILSEVLKTQAVSFKVVDNVVFLVPETRAVQQDEKRTITGKVVDLTNGESMIGVNLVAKRGADLLTGTATDTDGNFDLLIPADAEAIVVSMIGYKNREIPLTEKGEYFIELEPEMGDLNEVVVTGIFNKTKESFTGTSTNVTHDELVKVSPTNLIAALEVFDPGLQLIDDNDFGSDPNRMPEILIRGKANFQGNPNTPLFIMDGFEVSLESVYDLDMNRVEGVTILKDATAAALYGSRGANGVIVITTKAPESGKVRVHYSFTGSLEMPDLRDYNLMNAEEKLEYEKLSGLYGSSNPAQKYELDEEYNRKLGDVRRGVDTYWIGQPVETAFNQNHSIYIEGGSDVNRFGITGRVGLTDGVMKGSYRNRFGLGFKYHYIGKNGLTVRNHLTVDHVKSEQSPYGSFGDYTIPNPYDRMKDDNGDYLYELSYNMTNPLYEASLNSFNKNWYLEVRDNINLEWRFNDHLMWRASGSIGMQVSANDIFRDPRSHDFDAIRDSNEEDNVQKIGSYKKIDQDAYDWEVSSTVNYNTYINKHLINVGIGFNAREDHSNMTGFNGTGFVNSILNRPNYALTYQKDGRPMGSEATSRLIGGFANLTYGYDSRYYFDASFRIDGSSKFGKNKRTAPFWSSGLAWNAHNESFLKESFIHHLKLRASYGVTGSVNFSPYMAQTMYSYDYGSSQKIYDDRFVADIMALGNPDLVWQTTGKSNLGLEFGFLNYINGEVNFYREITDDLLVDMNIAPSMGFSSYKQNAGKIRNQGYEISLKSYLIKDPSNRFYVSVNGSLLHNENEILILSNEYKSQTEGTSEVMRFNEGESLSAVKLIRSAGIDPANGKEIFITPEGERTYEYDPLDVAIVGDSNPEFKGIIGANIVYKQFNLNVNFRYRWGAEIYNGTVADRVERANPRYNADIRALEERWREPGDVVYYRNISDYQSAVHASTRLLQTEKMLQLANLNFEYRAKDQLASKLGMSSLKGSFNMKDVFRISNIEQERGLIYPFSYMYSLSLRATF